jgi:hypothetical protein
LTDIASVNLGKVFSIGGGVMLSRFISIDPKKSQPRKLETGWFTWSQADQDRLSAFIKQETAADPGFLAGSANFSRKFLGKASDGSDTTLTAVDTALVVGQTYWAKSGRPLVKYLAEPLSEKDTAAAAAGINMNSNVDYVSAKTVFVMGRASFDPKPLLGGMDFLSPSDLVIYTEASILGLKNYPIYYRKTSERMPIMFGFYLPTFRALDYLVLEAEIFKNPHMNSDALPATFRAPQPKSPNGVAPEIPDIADPYYDVGSDQNNVNQTEDDFKWTVTAQKSFGVWNIAGQAGKDHFRPLTGAFRPSLTEAATTKDAWYYTIRLMVNL